MLTQEKKLLNRIRKEKEIRAQIELEGRREKEPNLLNISQAIDEYYCLNKLQLYCAYLSYTFINISFTSYSKNDFLFLKEIINETIVNDFGNPLIKVYRYLRLLFESIIEPDGDDEIIFQQLSDEIPVLMKYVSDEEGAKVYSYLTNYCAYKFNTKRTQFIQEFLIYSIRLLKIKAKHERKNDKFLPPTTFRNIVTAALHIKDDVDFFKTLSEQESKINRDKNPISNGVEWTEYFINQYKSRLSGSYADSYSQYSIALLLFHKKQFGKAYRILGNPFRRQGMFINLNTRILHLVILYEVFNTKPRILENDEIEILKVIESFRGLIRDDQKRKKQLNIHYLKLYKSFEQLFKRLYKLNIRYQGLKYKPESFSKLYNNLKIDIHQTDIPHKDWMQQKLEELVL